MPRGRRNRNGVPLRPTRPSMRTVGCGLLAIEYMKEEAEKEKEPKILKVVSIDERRNDNMEQHHTDEFDTERYFVVRRGQAFKYNVTFNKPLDIKNDELRFVFQFGKNPDQSKGTEVQMKLSDADLEGQWGVIPKPSSGKTTEITITTPYNCPVGMWSLRIETLNRKEKRIYQYNHPSSIYVLFNPWCKGDTVYLEGDNAADQQAKLDEYLLKETGHQYYGTKKQAGRRPWNFGQFESVVLDCVMYLLDEISDLAPRSRGNPILVTRAISALVNNNDDGGVLVGNWSGEYSGGTSPTEWVGSVKILEQYIKTKSPVCFGQCWVFSGVTTTICRCLGICTRSITNYASAHDTDGSCTIDKHYDGDWNELDSGDSIWNFHVWNECYFDRPDCPPGYGGWQAIDATPQELSNGKFQMGPYSLKAIKEGNLTMNYDGPFLFAEVNSDVVYWSHKEDGSVEVAYRDPYAVGYKVLTTGLKQEFEEITSGYKHDDGSKKGRQVVSKATKFGNFHKSKEDHIRDGQTDDDLFVDLKVKENMIIGQPLTVKLQVSNCNKTKTVTIQPGNVKLKSKFNHGVIHKFIKEFTTPEMILKPLEDGFHEMTVPYEDYYEKLTDFCMIQVEHRVQVKESGQYVVGTDDINLEKPKFKIEAPEKVKKGTSFPVKVSLKNPLNVALTNPVLSVEGPAFGYLTYKPENLAAGAEFSFAFEPKAKKKGMKEMLFIYNCDQILDVNSSVQISVVD